MITNKKNGRPARRTAKQFLLVLTLAIAGALTAPAPVLAQSEPEIHTGTISKQTVHSKRYLNP